MVWSCEKDLLTGELTGSIYYAGSTIPVPDVSLQMDVHKSTTDQTGKYTLRGPLGRYYLRAEKDGFDPFVSEVKIVQGSTSLNIYMTSAEYTSLVLGIVRGNHTGNPQVGVQIFILNPDGSESQLSTESDSKGNFQLPFVPRGERILIVKSEGIVIFQELIILTDAEYVLYIYLPEPFDFVDDRDGHVYKALLIGTQTWMIENLAWLPSVDGPAYGSYDEVFYYIFGYNGSELSEARSSSSYSDYGALYNWKAALSACPDGWHLPSDQEWQTLELFLGMSFFDTYSDGGRLDGEVGRKMKSKYGWNNNGNGDNSSQFNILPVGVRFDSGEFDSYGNRATMWTSTGSSEVFAWSRGFGGNVYWVDRDRHDLRNGLSVRCVEDN